jgi:hypothetical protein
VHSAPTLSPHTSEQARTDRGVLLLTCTAGLTLLLTGVGLFEGHVVYPSWRDLATFDDFAAYHRDYGRSLLPWLPFPLMVATGLNVWLIFRRPVSVPRALPIATLAGQAVIVAVTGALAIPLQVKLGTGGHTPAEIIDLVDRLIMVNYLRDVPGVAVAAGFVVMLHRTMRGAGR